MSGDKRMFDNGLPEPIPHPKLVEEVMRLREENKRLYRKLGQVIDENRFLHETVEELEMCMNWKDRRMIEAVHLWREANGHSQTVWPGIGELLDWLIESIHEK